MESCIEVVAALRESGVGASALEEETVEDGCAWIVWWGDGSVEIMEVYEVDDEGMIVLILIFVLSLESECVNVNDARGDLDSFIFRLEVMELNESGV